MQTTPKTSAHQQESVTREIAQSRATNAGGPALIAPELLQLIGGGKAGAPSQYTTITAAAPKNGW